MAQVTVYSTDICPYCVRAKKLLESKNISFKEVDLTYDEEQKKHLMEQTGLRTVPQIFIGDELVGGFQELDALNKSGELDKKLNL